MNESHDREIIGGHLLVIGGAEDKYNERRILKKFLELAGGDKAEVLIVPVASDFPEFASDIYVQAFGRRESARPSRNFAAGRYFDRRRSFARGRDRSFHHGRRSDAASFSD